MGGVSAGVARHEHRTVVLNGRGIKAALFGALLMGALASPGAAHAPASLCKARERPLFSCRLTAESVALCGDTGGVVARMKRSGGKRLASRALSFASEAYSGGGESQISFTAGKTTITIYDRMVRTGFAPGGPNDPAMSSGVMISRKGNTITDQRCKPETVIGTVSAASNTLPRGAFVDR